MSDSQQHILYRLRKAQKQLGKALVEGRDVVRNIQTFMRALSAAGSLFELARRATLVEALCGNGSDYVKARAEALKSYTGRPRSLSGAKLAIEQLRQSEGPTVLLWDVERESTHIEQVLSDDSPLKLSDEACDAFNRWRKACDRISQETELLEVDGCWFLFRIYQAGEGESSGYPVTAKANIESKAGSAWFSAIQAAAESLVNWAGSNEPGDFGRDTEVDQFIARIRHYQKNGPRSGNFEFDPRDCIRKIWMDMDTLGFVTPACPTIAAGRPRQPDDEFQNALRLALKTCVEHRWSASDAERPGLVTMEISIDWRQRIAELVHSARVEYDAKAKFQRMLDRWRQQVAEDKTTSSRLYPPISRDLTLVEKYALLVAIHDAFCPCRKEIVPLPNPMDDPAARAIAKRLSDKTQVVVPPDFEQAFYIVRSGVRKRMPDSDRLFVEDVVRNAEADLKEYCRKRGARTAGKQIISTETTAINGDEINGHENGSQPADNRIAGNKRHATWTQRETSEEWSEFIPKKKWRSILRESEKPLPMTTFQRRIKALGDSVRSKDRTHTLSIRLSALSETQRGRLEGNDEK